MDDTPIETPGPETWTQTIEAEQNSAEEMDEALTVKIARFLRLCWVRRRMVFGICAACILISLLIALVLPVTYTSTTTLMPPDGASPSSNIMSMLSDSRTASVASGVLSLNSPGDLFVGVLSSRTVQDSLITRFNLKKYYKTNLMEDARRSLTTHTSIAQDSKSKIISISVRASNPVLASQIAQAYVVELNRVMTDASTSSARRERIFLEERVKEVKQNLDDAAKALSQFSTKSGTIDMPSQARSMVDAGLKLQAELIEGRSQLAALQQTYSEDNSRVRAAEAHNAELQRQIDKMGGQPRDDNSNVYGTKSIYPAADELPALGLTYYDLERRVQVEETLWEALTKEYEAAKVQEVKDIPTVRVLDPANVPERKSAPRRALILLIGAILSIAAGCISVLAVTVWEEMDVEEEPKKLLTEVFGNVLHSQRKSSTTVL